MSPGVATRTRLVTLGIAATATFTTSAIVSATAGASAVDLVHVTTCATAPHVYPVAVPETKLSPAGNVSSTVIVPVVAAEPTFDTKSLNAPDVPVTNEPECDLPACRSGTPTTVASSVVRSFAALASLGVLTRAMFVAVPIAAALGDTCTISPLELPADSGPGFVHVSTSPVATTPVVTQLHPDPVVPITFTSAGIESTSVNVPVVGPPPTFDTASVHVLVTPTANVPACDLATARSGRSTVRDPVTEVSLAKSTSPAVLDAARFTTPLAALPPTATVSVTLTLSPAASTGDAGRVQLTFAPATEHVNPPPTPDTNVSPVGSGSFTVITPVVGPGETFFTLMSYVAVLPTVSGPVKLLVTARSGTLTTPTSPVLALSFAVLGSPGVRAHARLVTPGIADAVGFTVSVIVAVAPAAIPDAVVHVTTGAAKLHAKPAVPAADTNVSDAASVSVTTVLPVVAALPLFCTAIVNVPFTPTANVPLAVFVTPRSGTPAIGVPVTRLVSFVAFASPAVEPRARLFTAGSAPAVIPTVNVIVAVAAGASTGDAGRVHVTSGAAKAHAKPPPPAETNVSPADNESTTVITPLDAVAPTFVTAIEYTPFVPTVNTPAADFTTCRSTLLNTGTTTLPLLFPAAGSSAVVTVATFVALGAAAAATFTVSVMSTLSPAASGVPGGRAQVTTAPAAVHVNSVPVPLTKVSPAGSGSVTLIESDVAPAPTFFTRSRKLPVLPITNGGVTAVFTTVRSGTAIRIVRSEALLSTGVLSPPPAMRAVFVTDPGAATGMLTPSVIGGALELAAMSPGRVHVTTCPAMLQLHPAPLAAVGISGAGTVSVIVTVSGLVAALPMFETVIV